MRAVANLVSCAGLGRPTGIALLRAMSAFVILAGVVVESAVRALVESLRAALRFIPAPP
jgi:hypothetical protein